MVISPNQFKVASLRFVHLQYCENESDIACTHKKISKNDLNKSCSNLYVGHGLSIFKRTMMSK